MQTISNSDSTPPLVTTPLPTIAPAQSSLLNYFTHTIGKLSAISLLGFSLYFFMKPQEVAASSWLLFTVFVCNIVAIIVKPLPMGALALIAIGFLTATKTITLHTVLQGFSNDLIWLIMMACFLARSFIKTGLGKRIAYAFVSYFGGSPLGLGYGLLLSSVTMAPLIPSAAARAGGIILPVFKSLIQVLSGGATSTDTGKTNRIAQYLTMIVFHGTVITSAMFVTGNAGNPITIKFAKNMGIDISWGTWAMAAIVPGILSLLLLPLLLKFLLPCTVENAAQVKAHAQKELKSMGSVSKSEKMTLGVFGLLLVLWSCGSLFGIHPTEAAMFGVGLLLLMSVLNWKDILSEEMAWDTFFWMAVLVMMASELQAVGIVSYFTKQIVQVVPTSSWQLALAVICLIYFYTHYFFASTTAHLTSMYGPFLTVSCATGAPPLLAALTLSFISSLFGGLTHYASSPAPIIFAQGHVELKTWWKIGLITSFFYIVIWLGIGNLWWKWLGLY